MHLPLLVRTSILVDSGTTLRLLFNANYSPFPNTATLGGEGVNI